MIFLRDQQPFVLCFACPKVTHSFTEWNIQTTRERETERESERDRETKRETETGRQRPRDRKRTSKLNFRRIVVY